MATLSQQDLLPSTYSRWGGLGAPVRGTSFTEQDEIKKILPPPEHHPPKDSWQG